MVFALAITPKKTLHGLLTNHRDSTAKSSAGKTQQIGKSGFNCKCDNLVAESNFIEGKGFTITTPSALHSGFTLYYSSFLSLPHLLFNLRGPPVKF